MSEVEIKKSKKNKKSKQKKQETSSDVLERVMDSIEMAGASLDFFESDNESSESDKDAIELKEFNENQKELVDDVKDLSEDEAQNLIAASNELEEDFEKSLEASRVPDFSDDSEEAENLDMLPEDSQVEFIEQNQALSIVESLLFSSDRPLGIGTFKQVFQGTTFKTKDIKKALEELQIQYADSKRGVELEEINGGWQLRTKVDNMDFLRKLAKTRPFKLSGPALEVLAIIAYKQPLVKSEIDDIRGVESGHLVRALMEKHLVSFQGKSELPGKPMQYGTTKKFLEIFSFRNLRELPSLDEIDQLLPDGIGMEEEDEKLSDVTESLSEQYSGNYSEGEEELLKIEDTLSGIDISSEFFEQEKIRQREKRDRDRATDIREALDVGEEVEKKDQTWLMRYEEKIKLQEEEERAKEQLAKEQLESQNMDDLIAKPQALTEELSKLSLNGLIDVEVLMADDNLEKSDEEQFSEDSYQEDVDSQSQTMDPFDDIEEDSEL
jgi:segregation and condensation protein B